MILTIFVGVISFMAFQSVLISYIAILVAIISWTTAGDGIFPWFMIAATLLFFDPDWPRKLLRLPRPEFKEALLPSMRKQKLTLGLLGLYVTWQILFPLRYHVFPLGPRNILWTDEAYTFSWHMKMRNKEGKVNFTVKAPSGRLHWVEEKKGRRLYFQYRGAYF